MRSLAILTTLVGATLAGFLGFLIGNETLKRHLVAIFAISVFVSYIIGRRAKTSDEPWLPGLMALGMVAKLAGSWFRYYVLVVIYHGSGDAGRYHLFALDIADTWRALNVPDIATVAFGSEGTRFTAWITGLLYTPYEPSLLGGFWIYALLAYLGQFFLYLAFRQATHSSHWKRYAILIFFWPTLIYWPSSIGKEALILLFLGLGSWATSSLFRQYQLRWLPLIAASLFLVSMVRVHVAALLGAGLLATIFLERGRRDRGVLRRIVILLASVALLVPLAIDVGDQFGVDLASLSAEDLDPAFSRVANTTEQGGSAVSGGVIRTPADIPAGVVKVLFRPLPIEARNLQMLAASLEGAILMVLMAWKLPSILRNRRLFQRSPYLVFCAVYSALFIWAWSAILNLGILARQRSLVIPFILALVAGLGWSADSDTGDDAPTRDTTGDMREREPAPRVLTRAATTDS